MKEFSREQLIADIRAGRVYSQGVEIAVGEDGLYGQLTSFAQQASPSGRVGVPAAEKFADQVLDLVAEDPQYEIIR